MTIKYGFKWSQDMLRILLYMGAGAGLVTLKWYIGFPLMFICFTLARMTENSNIEIRQLKSTRNKMK